MKKIVITLLTIACLTGYIVYSQTLDNTKTMSEQTYPKALVDYDDFKNLVSEVEKHRNERLINLDVFLKMSKENNVVILDSRSDFRFNKKHLKGAIHLDFTDYTQDNLRTLIPDTTTKILIYCNNNFQGDQINFASKVALPLNSNMTPNMMQNQILSNRKPIMLALNIPTYINLYGYGYKNIYELDELVNINDSRITFEGTAVK
ncbi:rhodanese-like domain-containing protein [Cytophaga aurantiaca]|uniref:rhodanese-like domain-containing protein n=1 Tax=Cytophaga aurantiaca TaxID=29530 RepID=UPI00037E870A|nr:rhodanese-like domain-containing protein [Cytophaga aurantiaca]